MKRLITIGVSVCLSLSWFNAIADAPETHNQGSDPSLDIIEQQHILPGRIGRAFFANGIQNREPTRVLNRVESDREQVYFYSELLEFTDQIVTHRWVFNEQVEANIEFTVNGPRWRVWSRKVIPDDQRGLWQVQIIDQDNMIIDSYSIMAH